MTSTSGQPGLPAIFSALNPQQADGLSCIVCNAPFRVSPEIVSVPVGVAEIGGQVFACDTIECAVAVGYVPPVGEQMELQP